ncbi:acyltransferase family protein [Burkholderia vietnamiensis]|uniref:acyltransferase family protein n=1 Tax=Burkholderia vietnamiensis TaxID=60552 RepID=UPI001CF20C5A|nr:acyltransferase [Burkholderia vietnamiensis]MCA8198358.1 acyltransferase [Burkholderia vietnamiensis]
MVEKMAQQATRARRDIELDFVRGIAILLAMGWHFNGVQTTIPVIKALLAPGHVLGWAGVDLFFVLSGYLIGSLVFAEYVKTRQFQAKRFLSRRALKIWPVFYTFLIIVLISGVKPWREWLLQNALHVQNFFDAPIPHLWSLAVEEHFYLLFAASFALFAHYKGDIERIPYSLIIIMIMALLLRTIAVASGVDGHSLQIISFFRMDSLSAGVLLAYLKVFDAHRFDRLSSKKATLLATTAIGVGILASADAHGKFICSIGYTIAYITASAFVLFCYRHPVLVRASAPVRITAWIGVFSYGLYVWHVMMGKVSDIIIPRFHISDPTAIITLTIRYGGAIVVAVLVTRLVEVPFLRIRDRIFPAPAIVTPSEVDQVESKINASLQQCDRVEA